MGQTISLEGVCGGGGGYGLCFKCLQNILYNHEKEKKSER